MFDLGLSSYQIDEPERDLATSAGDRWICGWDPTSGIPAADYLNTVEARELVRVLGEYGDVPRGQARRISEEVIARRPLSTTPELLAAIRAAVGWVEKGGNPAKRVFQALRLQVNDELGSLRRRFRPLRNCSSGAEGLW